VAGQLQILAGAVGGVNTHIGQRGNATTEAKRVFQII
jgi:hypothetical protein